MKKSAFIFFICFIPALGQKGYIMVGIITEDKGASDNELDDALRYLLSMGISREKINKTLVKLKSIK